MSAEPQNKAINSCRHEYIKIFQRRLSGLVRRLVATKAYLPVGFKTTDLTHLGEGSYCFCTRCRVRLLPRKTNAEKAAARLAIAAAKQGEAIAISVIEQTPEQEVSEQEPTSTLAIDVEELELEVVDVKDIEEEGMRLLKEDNDDESCDLSGN